MKVRIFYIGYLENPNVKLVYYLMLFYGITDEVYVTLMKINLYPVVLETT